MDLSTYALLIVVAVVAITAVFAALRRATGTSNRDEIREAHVTDVLSAKVVHESRYARTDEELADRLLPSHAEAMILPIGAPMTSEHATFEGSLSEVRERVEAMSTADRSQIAIWTPGHIFDAAGLIAEPPGHEHDPLTSL